MNTTELNRNDEKKDTHHHVASLSKYSNKKTIVNQHVMILEENSPRIIKFWFGNYLKIKRIYVSFADKICYIYILIKNHINVREHVNLS